MSNSVNPFRQLNAAGQSVWSDHIHRAMLMRGGLVTMIEDDDLRGITVRAASERHLAGRLTRSRMKGLRR